MKFKYLYKKLKYVIPGYPRSDDKQTEKRGYIRVKRKEEHTDIF